MNVLHVGTAEETREEVTAAFAAKAGQPVTRYRDGTFSLGEPVLRFRLTLVGLGIGQWAFAVVEDEPDADL